MKMLEKIKSVNFKNLKLRKSKKTQGKRMIIIKKKQLLMKIQAKVNLLLGSIVMVQQQQLI